MIDPSRVTLSSPPPNPSLVYYLKLTGAYFRFYYRKLIAFIDASHPYPLQRWGFNAVLLIGFLARVILGQGWYVVCYSLGIYYLNAFLLFLSPKFDPAMGEDYDLDNDADLSMDGPGLPSSRQDEEFRPFIRRLPEFVFWFNGCRATLLSLCCTLTRITDIPVFWPILLVYFVLLFVLTMNRQIKHMIKHKYRPWNFGKPTFK